MIVSIPQAVGTIAIGAFAEGYVKKATVVSIPQAVGTIAMDKDFSIHGVINAGFNTASGRYYCNVTSPTKNNELFYRFNTASGRYYCNSSIIR